MSASSRANHPAEQTDAEPSGHPRRIPLSRFARIVSESSFIRLSPDTQALAPVGGPSDPVAPALYGDIRNSGAGDKLQAWSTLTKNSYTQGRDPDGQLTDCVLLNSVGAEANALEAGLLAARADGADVPDLLIDFTADEGARYLGRIGALSAPHRGYDALFRDSLLNGTPFSETTQGKALVGARPDNATPLLGLPHMAVFGAWHTQGAAGGAGAKFGRALKSEIVGYGAVPADIAASRIDPVGIARTVRIYKAPAPTGSAGADSGSDLLTDISPTSAPRPYLGWETDKTFAEKDNKQNPVLYTAKRQTGKEAGTAALLNHGNILPTARSGRATIAGAVHVMQLSLVSLRNLSFPESGSVASTKKRDGLAQTALAALALVAMTQRLCAGYHLRSGCDLIARKSARLEVLGNSLEDISHLEIDAAGARVLLGEAVAALRAAGMPWGFEEGLELRPSPQLVEAIRASIGLDDPEAG